jgi:carbohydrate-selective porin OprB
VSLVRSPRIVRPTCILIACLLISLTIARADTPPSEPAQSNAAVLLDSEAWRISDDETVEHPVSNVSRQRGLAELLAERNTLTDDWFRAGPAMEERGIAIGLGLTQIYQLQLHSTEGLQTHRRSGRYTGRYDLEATLDFELLLGIQGASLYAWAEGGWSDGIDTSSIGSWTNANSDAYLADQPIQLSVLYWQQNFLNDRVQVRLGKLDSSANSFEYNGFAIGSDANVYAEDETSQFLNGAFLFNPSIPFPWYSLGVSAVVVPTDWLYVYGAFVDDDPSEYGATSTFKTAFDGPAYVFTNVETGLMLNLPSLIGHGDLPGTYRFGMWYQNRPKDNAWNPARSRATTRIDDKRDDVGFYFNFDQLLFRETDDPEDSQGLGAFTRFGLTDGDANPISTFWSAGVQYQGLIPRRDNDVLGFAVANSRLGDYAEAVERNETVYEMYYNIEIAPWMHVSPSLQVITNPGGQDVGDAVVAGIRMHISF